MKPSQLAVLEKELPQVFDRRPDPFAGDEWLVAPIGNIESISADALEDILVEEVASQTASLNGVDAYQWKTPGYPFESKFEPKAGRGGGHPGALLNKVHFHEFNPPTDCYAFYLPFHYYNQETWGIYLLVEGIIQYGALF